MVSKNINKQKDKTKQEIPDISLEYLTRPKKQPDLTNDQATEAGATIPFGQGSFKNLSQQSCG